MKYLGLLVAALCSIALTSCFKEEALNSECDIRKAYMHLDFPLQMFYNETDTVKVVDSGSNTIIFDVRDTCDITALAPRFKLTKGATIFPESGSKHNFTDSIVYLVTSEDKNYSRRYSVRFNKIAETTAQDTVHYNFDNFALNTTGDYPGRYYVWSDKDANGNDQNNWSSGNEGFMLSNNKATFADVPTMPASEADHPTCVKLVTRSTGVFGKMASMPIAAGNIFIGEFDLTQAMVANSAGIKGVMATKFGKPFTGKPARFQGYYKYKRADTMTDAKLNVISGKDHGSIYAVFYDNHDESGKAFVLHGDDAITSSQIISIANLGEIDDTDGWVQFDIPFVLQPGKTISKSKLKSRGYSLAIVASSSFDGGSYKGAVGSTLYIDDFVITCGGE